MGYELLKKTSKFLLIMLLCIMISEGRAEQVDRPSERFKIDQGIVLVAGPVGRTVITQSDISRPSVDGRPVNLDVMINQELAYQEVQRMKMPIEDAAEKHIQTMKKEHGLSDEQIDGIFRQAGRTVQEGMQELTRLYAYNNLFDMKVASRIVIPHEEIEQYYNEYPEYEDAQYCIQISYIPTNGSQSFADQKQLLAEEIMKNDGANLSWKDPVWINESDIDSEREFITTMGINQVSPPQDSYNGFEVIRLLEVKERTLLPLERRYKNIMMILRKPRFEELMKAHETELRSQAFILPLK